MVMVVCKTDPAAGARGVSLILVETTEKASAAAASCTRWAAPQDTAELFFDNVRVPAGNLLGERTRASAT
jgi:acyl-CoA dehydrogenase/isovaleryl-CoA dehydrogenase